MFCKGNVESKLNLGRDCEARFGQDFNFRFSRDADVWLGFCIIEILKFKYVIICELLTVIL